MQKVFVSTIWRIAFNELATDPWVLALPAYPPRSNMCRFSSGAFDTNLRLIDVIKILSWNETVGHKIVVANSWSPQETHLRSSYLIAYVWLVAKRSIRSGQNHCRGQFRFCPGLIQSAQEQPGQHLLFAL